MKSNRIIWFIVVVMVVATIVTRMGTLRSSSQQSSPQITRTESTPPQQTQADADFMSQFPVADYDPPEEYDTEKKAKRELKNKRYDKRLLRLVTDELPFYDLEQDVIVIDDLGSIPAIPAGASEIVIVGEVLDAQAYVSNNKKGVYSEFTVRVSEVLKNNSSNITQGSSICIDREGGFVRYKNGKMRLYRIMGQGMPRVGRRYVLFLKNPEKSPNYEIIRAYELKADGIANLETSYQFKDYKDMKEPAFLEEVRKAVAQSSQPSQKEK
jgi:hypothetical protein